MISVATISSINYYFPMQNILYLVLLPSASADKKEVEMLRQFSSMGLSLGSALYQICDLGQLTEAFCALVSLPVKCGINFSLLGLC
jgi:hypothetical protein